jgi:hypothetical protein
MPEIHIVVVCPGPERTMKKTEHKAKAYALSLVARTESGRCEITMGLDQLTRLDRKFLFDSLKGTQEGGSVGFDMSQTPEGEQKITMLLRSATVVAAVRQEIPDHANGSH